MESQVLNFTVDDKYGFYIKWKQNRVLKIIGKKRSAVLLEFYVKKQRDYKEGIENTNGNIEAVLLRNIKVNRRSSLNMLEDRNGKKY